jgi:hypothetical protein
MLAQLLTRHKILRRLRNAFPGLDPCDEVDLKETYRLGEKSVKAHIKDYPFEICLAPHNKILHLYPEKLIDGSDNETSLQNYLLFDPDTFYSSVSGFYRLKDGDSITLGGSDVGQRAVLGLSEDLPERKLSISNEEGWLRFKSHVVSPDSSIAPLLTDKKAQYLVNWRQAKLEKLAAIFGQTIGLLPVEQALEQLQKVNAALEKEPYRATDDGGKPGGVIALPDKYNVITVGDLHAKPDNLLVVLTQNNFLDGLENGSACLVIIGDAVHPEGDAELDEMESSMLIMDLILALKLHFPRQVFYLRGNHDSFSEEIAKNGVPQGLIWGKALKKQRGKEYLREMKRFYELLPYVAYSRNFATCHAAPPVSDTSLRKMINIRSHPNLYNELINNRMKSANRPGGYGKRDVKRFRKCLGLAKDAPVITGHTPQDSDDTLWEHVGDISEHYIVYSSDTHWVGLMAQIGDKLYPFRYPVEPVMALFNARHQARNSKVPGKASRLVRRHWPG